MTKTMVMFLAGILAVVLPSLGLCEDEYPTNLELIEQAVRIAADFMDVDPPPGTSSSLEISAGSGTEAVWLLDSVLKEELLRKGWRIKAGKSVEADTASAGKATGAAARKGTGAAARKGSDTGAGEGAGAAAETYADGALDVAGGASGDAGYLLRLRVVELGLKYGRSWRRYLLGGKVVERVARASIYYELIDRSNDQVLKSSGVDGEVSDVVPASRLSILSNPSYSFASPVLEKSRWDKYLEGGLVIAIIGVLVYLFYSNKTAS
jgi:hypothetical protein